MGAFSTTLNGNFQSKNILKNFLDNFLVRDLFYLTWLISCTKSLGFSVIHCYASKVTSTETRNL